MWLGRNQPPDCTLTEWSSVKIEDGAGNALDVKLDTPIDVSRHGLPNRVTSLGSAYESFAWSNWCGGERSGPLHILIELPDDEGSVDWDVRGSSDAEAHLIAPPCIDPAKPSDLSISKTF